MHLRILISVVIQLQIDSSVQMFSKVLKIIIINNSHLKCLKHLNSTVYMKMYFCTFKKKCFSLLFNSAPHRLLLSFASTLYQPVVSYTLVISTVSFNRFCMNKHK